MSTTYVIGIERNGNEITSPAEAQALFAIGYRGALIWTSAWAITNARGVLDIAGLSALDQTITNVRNAGITDIALKLCGMPPWMTDTCKNSYGKYTQGPWSYKLDASGNAIPGSADFDETLDCVNNPSRILPASSKWLAQQLVSRYYARPISRGQQPVINAVICGNEYELGTYWPPVFALRNQPEGFNTAFRFAWDDFISPFSDGVRSSIPQNAPMLKLVGPEVAYTSGLQAFLGFDKETRRFDAISFHGYSDETPASAAGAMKHLDDMMAIADQFADGRPVHMTEIGVEDWLTDYLTQARAKYPQIASMTINDPAKMFSDMTTFALSPAGKAMKEFLTPGP